MLLLCRRFRHTRLLPGLLVTTAVLLAGCGSNPSRPPPVEDLHSGTVTPPPGAENAGKPGYYTVQPGETVRRIAAANGRDWRDLVRWNNLDNPDKIEVGQVLRVVPPGSTAAAAVVPPAAVAPSGPPVAVATQTTPGVSAAASPSSSGAATAGAVAVGAGDINFMWPAKGPILANFDGEKNKGIEIGGKAGDPVYAAADGRVVYAGSSLPGYGNLLIIKHNNTYLTAYAHNKTNLVKEDQSVKKGQKIAEMGSTDTDRVMLHFEVRRSGKPVNPAQYLPAH
jgi:lipoprotein NlpD